MGRRVLAWSLTAVLIVGVASGCKLPSSAKPYPHDPLFESKPPLEKPTASPRPTYFAAAAADPKPPKSPRTVYASARRSRALRSATAPEFPVTQMAEEGNDRAPVRVYGQADDYSWLQGYIEKQPAGQLILRYGDPTTKDRWGGKVQLDGDARLRLLGDGEVVRVEGLVVEDLVSVPAPERHHCPHYRVRNIERVVNGKDESQDGIGW